MNFNFVPMFLVTLIFLGVVSNNNSITISAAILLLMQQTALSQYIPFMEKHGLHFGIILLTIGVLSPLVSGKVQIPPLSEFVNFKMIAAVLIGILVAWLAGRGVPLMSEQPVLVTGLLIGTVIGVAFMGMSEAFHAVPAITAGAVVSGAFFGDKMSPLSDTTGIAASTVGVDLFEHIKNMSYTTIPALLLTAAALVWAVPDVVSGSLNSVQKLSGELQASGLVHGYALLPFAVLVVLALFKVDAILTMLATIAVSIAITFTHTPLSAGQLGGWLFAGFKPEHVGEGIAKLVSRGGFESMFFTQTVVMLALSLGGLLFALGIVPALLDAMRRFLTNAGRATFCVAMTSVGVNILIGEQYLSILLAGETFKPVYAKLGLHPRNLSRTLEDAGTVINPLVPWSVCGVFIAKVLGVSVLSYLPYAFFCYLCLILTVLFGFTGVTLSKVETEQK